MMNEKLIAEIVCLDKVLMEATLDDYDPKRRRQGLVRELNQGAIIVTNRNNENALIGYIEFLEKENNEIYVVSLQNLNSFISKSFLKSILDYLVLCDSKVLTSSVHKNNVKSINLHQKLGFRLIETDSRLLFVIEVQKLLLKIRELIG